MPAALPCAGVTRRGWWVRISSIPRRIALLPTFFLAAAVPARVVVPIQADRSRARDFNISLTPCHVFVGDLWNTAALGT